MLSEKNPEEEIKSLAMKFKQIEENDLLDMLVKTLCLYGNYVESFGKIHKQHEKIFELAEELAKNPILPELVVSIVDKNMPEIAGILLKIMSEVTNIAPQMNRFMELSADEKIRLGKDIKAVAKDFDELKSKR